MTMPEGFWYGVLLSGLPVSGGRQGLFVDLYGGCLLEFLLHGGVNHGH